jgi:phosphopantothenoylcysteine decarboxylase/phosphopantothenate--cysteine ligase
MGIALADAAAEYGAEVDLVLGPVSISPLNKSIRVVNVSTAGSMASECISRFPDCDAAILSAAVADFSPEKVEQKKIKRKNDEIIIRLKPTTDIAATLGKSKKKSQVLAGFALETDNEIEKASAKLKRKNLDFIVLNSLRDEGAGFGYDTNRITIIDRNNIIDKFELKSKEEVARDIIDKVVSMLKNLSE